MDKKKKTKKIYIKPVMNDNSSCVPFQYDVRGSIEKAKKVKQSEVFEFKKVKDKKY